MKKDVAKVVMAAAGVPVPRGRVVHRLEAAKASCARAALCAEARFRGLLLRRVHRQKRTVASAAGAGGAETGLMAI